MEQKLGLNYYAKRFLAAFIDVIIIAGTMLIYIKLKNGSFNTNEENVPSVIFIPFFYLYFILQEYFFKTTLGKRIFGMKVKSETNISLFKIVLRNIFNLIELIIPILYLTVVIVTGLTGKKKPKKLGDIISGYFVS